MAEPTLRWWENPLGLIAWSVVVAIIYALFPGTDMAALVALSVWGFGAVVWMLAGDLLACRDGEQRVAEATSVTPLQPAGVESVKRYLLFAGYTYYPSGGWKDLKESFHTIAEAVEEATTTTDNMIAEVGYDWWHIVDRETMEIALAGQGLTLTFEKGSCP